MKIVSIILFVLCTLFGIGILIYSIIDTIRWERRTKKIFKEIDEELERIKNSLEKGENPYD